jgi:hypothetical protein
VLNHGILREREFGMLARWRIWIVAILSLKLSLAALLGALFWAWNDVPDFYRAALAEDPALDQRDSDEFLSHVSALTRSLHHQGAWRAAFTTDQINGWLAHDLPHNHSHLLPEGFRDPRVTLTDKGAIIACTVGSGRWQTVLSLECDLYLADPQTVAVRLDRLRAGKLPVPLARVLGALTDAAGQAGWRLEWRQASGDPVALIHLKDTAKWQLASFDLGDQVVYFAGVTGSGNSSEPVTITQQDRLASGDSSDTNSNSQR